MNEERGNTKILSKFHERKSTLKALGVSRGGVDTGWGVGMRGSLAENMYQWHLLSVDSRCDTEAMLF